MRGKISIDGHQFKNENEYRRYRGVLELVKEGRLTQLEVNPEYLLVVNDVWIESYSPTFRFYDPIKKEYRTIQVNGTHHNPNLELKIKLYQVLFETEVERWG